MVVDRRGTHVWTEVPDFSASGPDDRHVVWDSNTGEVRFGPAIRHPDGGGRQHGAIPPRRCRDPRHRLPHGRRRARQRRRPHADRAAHRAAVRRVGHQPACPPRAASTPRRSQEAKVRGPLTLRTGQRAVTASDFEAIARQASVEVARARCLPAAQTGLVGGPGARRAAGAHRPAPAHDRRLRAVARAARRRRSRPERAPDGRRAGRAGHAVLPGRQRRGAGPRAARAARRDGAAARRRRAHAVRAPADRRRRRHRLAVRRHPDRRRPSPRWSRPSRVSWPSTSSSCSSTTCAPGGASAAAASPIAARAARAVPVGRPPACRAVPHEPRTTTGCSPAPARGCSRRTSSCGSCASSRSRPARCSRTPTTCPTWPTARSPRRRWSAAWRSGSGCPGSTTRSPRPCSARSWRPPARPCSGAAPPKGLPGCSSCTRAAR